jgi:alpha-L-rhamnosidase
MKKKNSAIILVFIFFAFVAEGRNSIDDLYPPVFVSEFVRPVKIVRTGHGEWFIDFGRAAFGTLKIDLEFKESRTLIVRLGEKLISPGKIDRIPGGAIRYCEVQLSVVPSQKSYVLKLPPDEWNTRPPAVALPRSFGVIIPFRYCEIENFNGELTGENISQKVYRYQFDDTASSFTSSDVVLNKIWDLCKYSIKATSFAGYYIDGDRERIPYEGDALINQLGHYSVDKEYSLARRTNEYFMHNPTWPTEWILHTVILFYYDYLYTGNVEPLERHYERLKVKTLVSLAREDGLISTLSSSADDDLMRRLGLRDPQKKIKDIVDWPESERDGYEMVPVNTVVNSFHYYNLALMAEIAERLGKTEDSKWFSIRAGRVKESINRRLIDRRRGIYVDGEGSIHSSLHANIFPLAFGLVPKESLKQVVEFVKSRGMACSVYGSQYLLDGLYRAGEQAYALSLLTSPSDRSWWNMIRSGSTMTLEAWDMKYKPNSDWNHAWGAVPANIITRQLWGIKPIEPGFARAEIRPQLAWLTSSKIVVPTIRGQITGEYFEIKKTDQFYNSDPE